MLTRYSLFWPCVLLLPACSGGDPGTSATTQGATVEIGVNALTLPDATDVLYDLTLKNGAAETVWSETAVSSNQYGAIDGSGSFTYFGPCDADSPAHTLTLSVNDLSGLAADEWVDPGPLDKTFTCLEDQSVQIDFDVTLLLDADQGFTDITVDFDDIFCSASVDCQNALLQDAAGTRIPTAVLNLTCTAGDDPITGATPDTVLYMDDLVVDCDGTDDDALIDPAPTDDGLNTTADGVVLTHSVARRNLDDAFDNAEGTDGEEITFWQIALGLDTSKTNCTLTTSATASNGPLTSATTPADTTYPVIDFSVALTDGSGMVCTQHGLTATENTGDVHVSYVGDGDADGTFAGQTFANEYDSGAPTVLYLAYNGTQQLTGILSHGGSTGIAGADAFCVTYHGAGYKAVISDGTTRDATSLTDWVLQPNTTYLRLEDDAVIGTTNASAVFDFPIGNRWSMLGGNIWSGMQADWSNDDSNDCQNWTTDSSAENGIIASTEVFTSQAVANGASGCNTTKKILCAQQP